MTSNLDPGTHPTRLYVGADGPIDANQAAMSYGSPEAPGYTATDLSQFAGFFDGSVGGGLNSLGVDGNADASGIR